MRQIDVEGIPVCFTDRGQGPLVLLLHGNPDCASMWDDLIARLAPHHRCLAPDLPGFGATPVPDDFEYSLERCARFVEGFVDALGIEEPVALVVHDIGGFFGLAWAVRHRERLRRLVITNTLFHPDYRWHFWGRVWRTRGLGELAMAIMQRWSLGHEMRRGSPRLPRAHIERTWAAYRRPVRRAVLRLYRACDPHVFAGWDRELLELTAQVPTRVYWGERDPYIPKSFAHRFGAEAVRLFPQCGHWVALEDVDTLAAELLPFLEERSAA